MSRAAQRRAKRARPARVRGEPLRPINCEHAEGAGGRRAGEHGRRRSRGQRRRILDAYEAAAAAGADLVVFPELTITGYPPEDLLLRPAFVAEAAEALEKLAARTGTTAAIVGFPEPGRDLSNAAAVLAHGRVQGVYRKHLLPNYAVFDEQRYFVPGDDYGPLFVIAGVRVAVSICEDAWSPTGPIAHQAAGGAELAVNLNASPYYAGRLHERETMLATRAADASIPVVYANLVGGQDELVFDGGSLVIDAQGELVARAKQFEEDLLVVDLDVRAAFRKRLLDPRGRARSTPLPEVTVTEAHLGSHRAPDARGSSRCFPGARGLRGPRARHARLRAQERLLRRAHRALGRGRLRDRRDDRGRRPRRRARDRCAHAVAILERSQRHRRARPSPPTSASPR